MEKFNLFLTINLIKRIKNFLSPLLDFYFPNLIKRGYTINTKEGIKFWIRPKGNKVVGDIDILIEILIEDQYRINKILRSGYKVIDVGGQVGFFSIMASNVVGKNGEVYVFEPFKPNFNRLIKNLKLNKTKNIIPYNMAVGRLEDKAKFFISKSNVGAHSLMNNKNNEFTIVKSINLKKIFQENNLKRINLLKIDCEGCEYDILLKTPKDILRKIDTIIFEQHINSSTKKYGETSIIEHLKFMGFSTRILKKIYYEKEGKFFIVLARRISKKKNGSNSI